MKAKAPDFPEKVYIPRDPEFPQSPNIWWERESSDSSIEYTRTDAFIEKALAYLNTKFYFHNAFYGVVSTDFSAIEELFEDFEEYLKK